MLFRYAKLLDRLRTEGLCPICLMKMELPPQYLCICAHIICQRCKPYYRYCPLCEEPLVPQYVDDSPSASSMDNSFLRSEEGACKPSVPSQNENSELCSYCNLECWMKVTEKLRALHELSCQFRPRLEEEQMLTDSHYDLEECTFAGVGCKVRMVPWRRRFHERFCTYGIQTDFLETEIRAWKPLVSPPVLESEACSYSSVGCWIKVPENLRELHESRCQFRPNLEKEPMPTDLHYDDSDLVECLFADAGCKIRMVPWRRNIHLTFCTYQFPGAEVVINSINLLSVTLAEEDSDVEKEPYGLMRCRFEEHGCTARVPGRQKYVHEEKCNYQYHEVNINHETYLYIGQTEIDPKTRAKATCPYGCGRIFTSTDYKRVHESKCKLIKK